jgi:hypothetical protein
VLIVVVWLGVCERTAARSSAPLIHSAPAHLLFFLFPIDLAMVLVRQNMYRELEELGRLPKVDAKPMGYGFDCVVGVTQPLDPKKYPILEDEFCEFEIMLGKDIPFNVSDSRILSHCGMVSLGSKCTMLLIFSSDYLLSGGSCHFKDAGSDGWSSRMSARVVNKETFDTRNGVLKQH